MARGKKKETALTPEEKLAQALVPDWEQPYKVPENWCWGRLGAFSTNQYGFTAKAIEDDALPKMLRITDIQDSGVDWTSVPNCQISDADYEKYLLQNNDIVIARIGATTGKSFLLQKPRNSVFSSYLIRLRVSNTFIPQYVYQFLQTDVYWKQISELSSGIALPGVNSSKLQTMMIPIAPVSEQQRIIDRIESLFAKLDEAKEKAQSVLDSFETRKAAILHQAFTGELTAKWRRINQIIETEWTNTLFDSIANAVDPHPSHRTPPTHSDGIPYVGIAECNYESKEIDFSSARKVSKEILNEHLARYQLTPGDFIIGKIGTVGKPFRIPSEQTYALSANVVLIQPHTNNVNSTFLFYYFQSDFAEQQFKAGVKATTQAAFGIKKVRDMSIAIPTTMEEQQEVVHILDSLFAKEQQAKEAAEAVLEKIDLLKKSILARAFRGELGTNAPTEESAVELLKTILDIDTPEVHKKRSKTIPKDIQEKLASELERKIIKLYLQRETDSLPAEELVSISSKKFEVMEALHNMELRGILKRLNNGNYRLLE